MSGTLCVMVPRGFMGMMALGAVMSSDLNETSLRGRGQRQGCGEKD
ncbi:MAG TPA: hypothetical protein VFL34_12640 [Candidatus Sulfotelmatobacter sp.]|nr:hypothetical protein [Candidatus Sulfotelmatobacter sp.]